MMTAGNRPTSLSHSESSQAISNNSVVVLRRNQHIASYGTAGGLEQCPLLLPLDIAAQQHTAPGSAHTQHARHRVRFQRARVVCRERAQQLDPHTVPFPGLAGFAPFGAVRCRKQRMALFERTQQVADGQRLQYRARTADMIKIAVASTSRSMRASPRARKSGKTTR